MEAHETCPRTAADAVMRGRGRERESNNIRDLVCREYRHNQQAGYSDTRLVFHVQVQSCGGETQKSLILNNLSGSRTSIQ